MEVGFLESATLDGERHCRLKVIVRQAHPGKDYYDRNVQARQEAFLATQFQTTQFQTLLGRRRGPPRIGRATSWPGRWIARRSGESRERCVRSSL